MNKKLRFLSLVFSLITFHVFAQTEDPYPTVHAIYLVPTDLSVNNNYVSAIEEAMIEIQNFYYQQLDGAARFKLSDPVVEVIQGKHTSLEYGMDPWSISIEDSGAEFFDPNNTYIIYVDAYQDCSASSNFGGSSGIAVMGANDLHGLINDGVYVPVCPDDAVDSRSYNYGRWVGGLGHEVGHAFYLDHLCNSSNNNCSNDSGRASGIMDYGYLDYPVTYFHDDSIYSLKNDGHLRNGLAYPNATPQLQNFDTSLAAWDNVGEFQWSRNQGATSSSSTGPSSAADGSYYLYFETSRGSAYSSNDTAIIESPSFYGLATLNFKYHMYGAAIGTLAVELYDGTRWRQVWLKSGQQHLSSDAAWTSVSINLDTNNSVKVRFRAVAAGGYLGDIAIDAVSITRDKPFITNYWYDDTWAYLEWLPADQANHYYQFVVGKEDNGTQYSLFRDNSGASDRTSSTLGNYRYQYYNKSEICNAFNATGTFSMWMQVWPNDENTKAQSTPEFDLITCN